MNRKNSYFAVTCAVFAAVILTFGTTAYSAPYESLYSCLKDLSGWKGDKPTGMQANMGGMKMMSANRTYRRGGKKATVTIIQGQQVQGMMMPSASKRKEMTMDTPQGIIAIKEIKGFYVQIIYKKDRKQGTVLVPLTSGKQKVPALFVFHFEGLSLEKGKALAESFDWKEMRGKLKAIK